MQVVGKLGAFFFGVLVLRMDCHIGAYTGTMPYEEPTDLNTAQNPGLSVMQTRGSFNFSRITASSLREIISGIS